MNSVDLSGLGRLKDKFGRLSNIDPTPLLTTWMRIIEEDNRKGVLAGLDKDGKPMAPVAYRPRTSKPTKIGSKGAAGLRNNANTRARSGIFGGLGPMASGLHNNLTRKQYERLAGPPLAPRGKFSRVITNLRTAYGRLGVNEWIAWGAWFEVVSTKRVPFLSAHFEGKGQKRRDLTGVRPEGLRKARRAAVAWMSDLVRFQGGSSNRAA